MPLGSCSYAQSTLTLFYFGINFPFSTFCHCLHTPAGSDISPNISHSLTLWQYNIELWYLLNCWDFKCLHAWVTHTYTPLNRIHFPCFRRISFGEAQKPIRKNFKYSFILSWLNDSSRLSERASGEREGGKKEEVYKSV